MPASVPNLSAASVAIALLLAGCGPTIDQTTASPVTANGGSPRPATSQEFPRLQSIPVLPPAFPSTSSRETIREDLERDRAEARALAPAVDPDPSSDSFALPTTVPSS